MRSSRTVCAWLTLGSLAFPQGLEQPRGLYAFAGASNPASFLDHDFVAGYLQRVSWAEFEPSPGQYEFAAIDSFVAQTEAKSRSMTLIVFAAMPPAWLLAQPGVATYTHPSFGLTVVPWDATALARWDLVAQALADHLVPSAAHAGALVRLADHPVLRQINAPVVGMNSLRAIPNAHTMLPGYDRTRFTNAVLQSVHSIRDRFPSKFAYCGFFPLQDTSQLPPLWQHIDAQFDAHFDGVSAPMLGRFQELWAASKDPLTQVVTGQPSATGLGQPLLASPATSYVMLQAQQGWECPFANPNTVANATPDDGLRFAYDTYGCTYYEVYPCDLDEPAHAADLREWAARIASANYCAGAPNSVGSGARIGRVGSVSLSRNDMSLRVDGAPSNVSGIFFYGAVKHNATLGNGTLCVATPVARLARLSTSDASGVFLRALDFNAGPLASGPLRLTPGSTWNFQCWYRDPASGGAMANSSDAIAIQFLP
ncbi:MAG: beta-galactosidase [Planctomycetes bacterium]|nr:beta-galactosidase [Planctomycetota bacterium]